MIGSTWLITCVLALSGQDVLVEKEAWPDGTPRVEREVVEVDGAKQLHGSFRSWFENGQLQEEGNYKEGWRSGLWRHYHENGQLAAEGAYRLGLRNSRWKYWDADGKTEGSRQGTFRAEIQEYPSGVRRIGGEYKGKHRDGEWTYYGPDGTILAQGGYSRDRRNGPWKFYWGADGSLCYEGDYLRDERENAWSFYLPGGRQDPAILSGMYHGDERLDNLPKLADPVVDLSTLPPLSQPDDLDEETRSSITKSVSIFPNRDSGSLSITQLLEVGRSITPFAIERMKSLDLSLATDVSLGFQLNYDLLARIHRGNAYRWSPGVSEEEQRANSLTVARWQALWECTRAYPDYVAGLPEAAVGSEPPPQFFQLPFDPFALPDPSSAPVSVASTIAADPKKRRSALSKYGGKGTEKALVAALDWICAHQSEDGSWAPDNFSLHCAKAKAKEFCAGGGERAHQVGVSALCLLALMGDGNSPVAGARADAVARGVDWLANQHNPKTGLIGGEFGQSFIYDHALATMALCRALRSGGSPKLQSIIEKAMEYVVPRQLPSGGWRYDTYSGDLPDSSVTSWILHMLVAVEECGIDVDAAMKDRAMDWLTTVTDPETGEVGYTEMGSQSARVPGKNDEFERSCETLTATSLFARIDAGRTPRNDKAIEKQADLILAKLPSWKPNSADYYGWYQATYAMFHIGGKSWKAWNNAQKDALLDAQNTDEKSHEFGSFSVDSVWAHAGGRIYTTAMAALTLEVYFSGEPRLN